MKNQNPWNTCWSFADIASSETSILNSLGMTTAQYRDKFGEDLNLSERIPTGGGEAAICPEDGYLLLDIAK